ncbi:MAG: UDP-N-acetylmuramate--L-alanine ligase [Candidatus Improbicoccus devescovinae]|nr:MAG: UDP-N-acetylmuramate--L-alanine ligase [Candidatus Improbicoccus devescovinae]
MNVNYDKQSVYFIGIGGSGMAPLASVALARGCYVSGSDSKDSHVISKLRAKGININIGHKNDIGDVDYVVYSAAIKENNPEILAAKIRNIKTVKRSRFLGDITRNYSKMVAVSGSHGKTTTSSMVAEILKHANKDPTAIVGAEMRGIGEGFIAGNSEYAVCEACEFMDAFLDLDPTVGVILNIDNDHLDYFGTIENEKISFNKFAKRCTKSIVINGDDMNSIDAVANINADKIFYGIKKRTSLKKLDIYAQNINLDKNGMPEFEIVSEISHEKIQLKLQVPGVHNISNALAAISACERLGMNLYESAEGLKNFIGTRRRFELLGQVNGITIVDDFAHHPTEIEALYNIVFNLGYKRTRIIFQPHTFSRTFLLLEDFAEVLSRFDEVILTDILPVREINTYGISSENLAIKITKYSKTCNVKVGGTFDTCANLAIDDAQEGDIIITVGGGNVYECAYMILNEFLKGASNKNN